MPPHDPSQPPTHGRAWITPQQPETLHLTGEIEQPVVQAALASVTDADLAAVDVVDMSGVTFLDSSAISLVANLLRTRTRPDPVVVDNAPDVAVFLLEIAGLADVVKILPA